MALRLDLRGFSLEQAMGALLLAGLLVFAALAYVANGQFNQLDETALSSDHTRETLDSIERVTIAVLDAETGQRGYLLTSQDSHLDPYRSGLAAVQLHLVEAERKIGNHPAQQLRLEHLRSLVAQKLAVMAQTISLHAQRPEAALAIIRGGEGKRLMNEIRAVSAEMMADEKAQLVARTAAARQARDATVRLGGATLAVLFVVFTGGFVLIRRELRLRATLAQALRGQQAQLLQSERDLRAITDNLPAIISRFDVHHRCTFINEHFRRVFAVDPARHIGRTAREFRGDAFHDQIKDHLDAALRGEARQFEIHASMQGREPWTQKSLIPDLDADGRVQGYFSVSFDITERKRQEEALRKSELFLDRTGRLAGVGGWEFDLVTQKIIWSDETCRIHGVEPGYQPVLERAVEFYAPAARPVIDAAVQSGMTTGEPWDLELPVIRADGQRIWVRTVGSVEFAEGKPVRMFGAFQDVSERIARQHALKEANERVALATDSGGIGIWEWDLDGESPFWDAWMHRLFGDPNNSGTPPTTLWQRGVHPDDLAATEQAMWAAMRGGKPFDTEFRVVWPDGSVHHLRSTARVTRDASGRVLRLTGANWDITEQRRLAAELAEERSLLRVTLASIGDAVITTDARGDITWLNPVAERLTGWLANEAQGRPLMQVFHIVNESSREPAPDPVASCLEQGQIVGLANHTLLLARDGSEYGIEDSAAPIRNERGDVLGAVLVFHDVSEQRRLSGEMSYRATHDAMTGLVNRAEFETRLQRMLTKAHEDDSHHALLYIDLDQFKLVNDACGHAVGDQLLQQMAKLLGEAIRNRDTLARLGGDEFAIILEHCSTDQAQRVAQKICDRMDDFRFIHEERRFRIGTSIGLVPVDKRWATTVAIQQAADASCYAAKEAGRNRVHAWFDTDSAMHERQFEMQWTARIETALDEDGFVLFAQRIEPLRSEPTGLHAEVLLRMKDGNGSMVLPGAFLPAAERFHLASRIDRWVLKRVVDWMKSLPAQAKIELLSVNLSGQSVGDRTFHRWALDLLAEAGPRICKTLCLEITETSAVTHIADAALFIDQVRAVGVTVALDDFGAGASSFGYLKNLSVDFLKIDGQFVRDMVDDPLDEAAVRCFADVAKVVGVKTVAVSVDKPAVLERLRGIGIDFAQGFLLHRPSPIDELLMPVCTQA